MVQLPSMSEMLKSGMHFGHKRSRKHPKMDDYVYATRNDVAIIDLEKTTVRLQEALDFLTQTVRKGGVVLFVGTKKQAGAIIEHAAEECGMPFVAHHWIGGTITNFNVISRMIKKFKKMKEQMENGELASKYTKKEQLDFTREHDELRTMLGGIQDLVRVPDALFIVDMKHESTALREGMRKKIPIVAICDVNANPELVHYPIPANDDAVKSIALVVSLAAQAIKDGVHLREKDIAQGQVVGSSSTPAPKVDFTHNEESTSTRTL